MRDPIPEDYASAKRSIIPIVRSESYFSLTDLSIAASAEETSKSGTDGIQEKFSEDLVARVAFDTELATTIIQKATLERWGVSFEEAYGQARHNLFGVTNPSLLVETVSGLYEGQWADSYESSRILLPELVGGLRLNGSPVVFVPQRNKFWVCGSEDTFALSKMVRDGSKSHFEAYPLSPYLHIFHDGQWSKFVPEDASQRGALASLERRRLALDYGQQKKYFDAIHGRENSDIFVASFVLFEHTESKREFSACVWSRGVDAFLPRTERIVFNINPETEERLTVSWERAEAVVGRLMEKHPHWVPERYRVQSFPSGEELAELRSTGIP